MLLTPQTVSSCGTTIAAAQEAVARHPSCMVGKCTSVTIFVTRQLVLCWMPIPEIVIRRFQLRYTTGFHWQPCFVPPERDSCWSRHTERTAVVELCRRRRSISAPLVVNQTIYIGSSSGTLYGLNPSGQQIWSTQVGAPIPCPWRRERYCDNRVGFGRWPLGCTD